MQLIEVIYLTIKACEFHVNASVFNSKLLQLEMNKTTCALVVLIGLFCASIAQINVHERSLSIKTKIGNISIQDATNHCNQSFIIRSGKKF